MSTLYVKCYCRAGNSIHILVTAVVIFSVNNNEAGEKKNPEDFLIESILNLFACFFNCLRACVCVWGGVHAHVCKIHFSVYFISKFDKFHLNTHIC